MHATNDNTTPKRSVLMRILIRSWEYRHPHVWVNVRFACAAFNFGLGVLLLSGGYWIGALPLAATALISWTAYRLRSWTDYRLRSWTDYRLQHSVQT